DVPTGTKLTKGDEISAVAKKPGSDKVSEPAKTIVTGDEKPADKPAIDPIKDTDKVITGTGTPGDEITVKDPEGKEIGKTTVDQDGKWTLDVPTGTKLTKGDEISAVAKKPGTDKESEPAKTSLPKTGGEHSFIMQYLGGVLVLIGGFIVGYKRRKHS
ncbi:Ig-like domain-containing protein, partial [Bacillus paramycoides]|uniref:Ig-like domain-containing protein n=1 Tax=Bacillus paramycoides TaxID=2026194 RepID=UPI002E1EFFBA|nr:Ig-like domain-containing protein [Bacillus paramycoides]